MYGLSNGISHRSYKGIKPVTSNSFRRSISNYISSPSDTNGSCSNILTIAGVLMLTIREEIEIELAELLRQEEADYDARQEIVDMIFSIDDLIVADEVTETPNGLL